MQLLHAVLKGTDEAGVALTQEEDRLLREAFGGYGGGHDARAKAAPVVARYQQMSGGMWFACGCRHDGRRARLVPVSQSHIRREESDRWPEHEETCDFFRDHKEQRQIVRSYTRQAAAGALRLARRFGESMSSLDRVFVGVSNARQRRGLARLLARLVEDAGLQTVSPGWQAGPPSGQFRALRRASEHIFLDSNARLSDFLKTYAPALGELAALVEMAEPGCFTRNRPHGVLITLLDAVGDRELRPLVGAPIPIRGRVSVFGERAERDFGADGPNARAPYLAACVVGRADEGGPVEVLSAYAHPCAARNHLMLVDSNYERRTLKRLLGLQAWLLAKHGIEMTIEKPVFDIGPDDDDEQEPVGRGVCIPDFVLRARGGREGGRDTVIVETMGFADDDYRARKKRTHAWMSAALGGAPVVLHEPAIDGETEREREFGQRLVRLILGSADRQRDASPPVRPR